MTDYKVKISVGWVDLDDLPSLREYVQEFATTYCHDGLHTGSIVCESAEGPDEDGDLTLQMEWVDLDDVPGLLADIERRFGFDGLHTGTISALSVEFV